jgi:hypothetical protein
VTAWWLAMERVVVEDMVAAVAPAKTTQRATMRMASFIIGNPLSDWIDGKDIFPDTEIVDQI